MIKLAYMAGKTVAMARQNETGSEKTGQTSPQCDRTSPSRDGSQIEDHEAPGAVARVGKDPWEAWRGHPLAAAA